MPNRIVMAPMTTRAADTEGFVTAQTIAYYVARRVASALSRWRWPRPNAAGATAGANSARFLPGLARLASASRAEGAKTSIQLGHGGGHTRLNICGAQPIAPSAIPHLVEEVTSETIMPEAMSPARIEKTTAQFVAAAERARAAGFDCVEMHAAHGYLISQFHMPFENLLDAARRGSIEARAWMPSAGWRSSVLLTRFAQRGSFWPPNDMA